MALVVLIFSEGFDNFIQLSSQKKTPTKDSKGTPWTWIETHDS